MGETGVEAEWLNYEGTAIRKRRQQICSALISPRHIPTLPIAAGAGHHSTKSRAREDELIVTAIAIAERLNLRKVIYHRSSELSGGQKKLLEIGRALMADPKMILLDEPIAGVNPTLARRSASTCRRSPPKGCRSS